jgi:hypothetical protein
MVSLLSIAAFVATLAAVVGGVLLVDSSDRAAVTLLWFALVASVASVVFGLIAWRARSKDHRTDRPDRVHPSVRP